MFRTDNPEGGIAVLKFQPASTGSIADDTAAGFRFHSFAAHGFNDAAKRDPLLQAGVRWSLRPETKTVGFVGGDKVNIIIEDTQTTFSRDLEPEYLALSADGKTVYVGLQENCAIAIFDLETETIKDIKPLQRKSPMHHSPFALGDRHLRCH